MLLPPASTLLRFTILLTRDNMTTTAAVCRPAAPLIFGNNPSADQADPTKRLMGW